MTATPQPSSPLERLRARREQLAREKTTDIDVAGYGGELVARYHLLDPLADGKEIGDRVSAQYPKQPEEQRYYALVDSLIRACDGLYLRNEDGTVEAIDPEGQGVVTYSDPRLGAGLGFEATTARETVLELFGGNRNAVIAHALQLQRWFADTTGELGATIG